MFEQAFKNIDDVLWKEAGCTTELDYTEQTSWLLFLKYLDNLEEDKAMEAALEGRPWNEATLALALQALAADFDPLTDLRASASYRRRAAAGLLRRFHLETRADAPPSPVQTRVFSAFDSLTPQPGAASTHASNARDANTGAGDSGAVDLYPPDA